MAGKTAKKKSTTTKSTTRQNKTLSEAKRLQKHRMWSTVLSIIGVFLLFLTWLKGESLWDGMQKVLWGLFGISAALVAPIVIYVAIMLALDKSKSAVVTKLMQGLALVLLISPLFEITYSMSAKVHAFSQGNVSEIIGALYVNGAENHKGGGAVSVFLGGILSKLCGDVCALIIIILLILLFVMLLTNITFVDLFKAISRLVSRIKASLDESTEEAAIRRLEREEEQKRRAAEEEARNKERRIDVAKFITDEHPQIINSTEEKEQKSRRKKKSELMPADFITSDEPSEKHRQETVDVEQNKEPAVISSEVNTEDIVAPIEPHLAVVTEQPGTVASVTKKEDKPQKLDSLEVEGNETSNSIYIDKDGQTTLIEMDDTSESGYIVPPIELLNPAQSTVSSDDTAMEADKNAETLVETLKSFGVVTRIVGIHRGPSVTRYELQPAAGVKVSKITSLADDIALNLAANGVRIEAPIPGKAAVGIELANKVRETVCIRELIDSDEFRNAGGKLCFPVGKDIEGKIIVGDISKMPHILIAGTTGSGKSVFTNSIIMSILYNASAEEVKLILIDPKQVEFPVYNGIPHLLIPVVTEAKKAAGALGWAVTEMLKRYKLFADNGVRDLKDFNKLAKEDDNNLAPMPQIVIVVDELADLMMAAPKEVEDSICRLAQLARAAGMHLIIATQSPRVDIVTGLIKANIPSRVALKVSNQIDSRVILDEGGADKLLGNGDLLYKPVGLGKPVRIQGSYVATEEIKRVVDFLKAQSTTQYDEEIAGEIEKHIPVPKGEKAAQAETSSESSSDNMTDRAIEAVVEAGQASTSFLQRKLKLGYARAARIMDELEEMGIVGPADGAKPREVRMTRTQWMERKSSIAGSDNISNGEN